MKFQKFHAGQAISAPDPLGTATSNWQRLTLAAKAASLTESHATDVLCRRFLVTRSEKSYIALLFSLVLFLEMVLMQPGIEGRNHCRVLCGVCAGSWTAAHECKVDHHVDSLCNTPQGWLKIDGNEVSNEGKFM